MKEEAAEWAGQTTSGLGCVLPSTRGLSLFFFWKTKRPDPPELLGDLTGLRQLGRFLLRVPVRMCQDWPTQFLLARYLLAWCRRMKHSSFAYPITSREKKYKLRLQTDCYQRQ